MPNEVIVQTGYGYQLELTVTSWDIVSETWIPTDCSAFIDTKLRIKKPDGTLVDKPASFKTTGTDGTFKYIVTSGVGMFNQKGYYEAQLLLVTSGALQFFPTSVVGFDVDNPL
jgi:hypothetical protein